MMLLSNKQPDLLSQLSIFILRKLFNREKIVIKTKSNIEVSKKTLQVDHVGDFDNINNQWQKLRQLSSSEARKVIPKSCYAKSTFRNFFWCLFDLSIFFTGMCIIFVSHDITLKLLGGVIAGIASAMMFIWAHDAAHGALFKNTKTAEILGTLLMLPSLSVYRMWSYGHNKVHHGFVSLTTIDAVWSPLSPDEYSSLSVFERILYRLERNFFTCALYYLRQIWWKSTWRFNPGKNTKQRLYYRKGKVLLAFYMIVICALAYYFAGGFIGVISVCILPLIIFNYGISFLIYLHHTHPDIAYFKQRSEWSHTIGALYCCTVLRSSKYFKILTHNIMIHIPHHLDFRIPFYHLPQAYQALKNEYGIHFHEYKLSWRYVFNVFKKCKLYDYENKMWLTFKEVL